MGFCKRGVNNLEVSQSRFFGMISDKFGGGGEKGGLECFPIGLSGG